MSEPQKAYKIFFAHANGFPSHTYTKLFSFLENEFEIDFLERHGHNPEFPVNDNWVFLRDELREEIEKRYQGKPIIGIGHSLGGILHFLVACEKPELYSQIILLDAPIISRLSSRGLQLLKLAKLMDRFSPSQVTRFRRNIWQTREEAFEHFNAKPKFAAFDEEVLRDYINFGTVGCEKGFELFFKPSIEAAIYRTIPHDLPNFRGKLNVPMTYIGGTDSREGKLARLGFMKNNFSIRTEIVEGSHLFPFERPFETAEKILKVIYSQ